MFISKANRTRLLVILLFACVQRPNTSKEMYPVSPVFNEEINHQVDQIKNGCFVSSHDAAVTLKTNQIGKHLSVLIAEEFHTLLKFRINDSSTTNY